MPCRYISGSTSATFGHLRHHGGRIELRNRHRSPVSSSTRRSFTRGALHLDPPRAGGDRARLGVPVADHQPPAPLVDARRPSAAMYASTSASSAAASIRRAPSRTISSSADAQLRRGRRRRSLLSTSAFLPRRRCQRRRARFGSTRKVRRALERSGRSTSSGHTSCSGALPEPARLLRSQTRPLSVLSCSKNWRCFTSRCGARITSSCRAVPSFVATGFNCWGRFIGHREYG